jgi:predicted MFS family arabinose efflux permease
MGALTGAGLFAGLGIGAAYVGVTGLYAAGLVLIVVMGWSMRAPGPAAAPALATGSAHASPRRASHWGDLKEGLALVWSTPVLLVAILVAVLVNFLAFPFSIQFLPYIAKEIYAVDARGLGYLMASFSLGALLGSVAVSTRTGVAPTRTMIVSVVAWFACLLAFAQMWSLWSGAAVLALAGFAQSFCMVTVAVVLLGSAGGKFQGRIMGVRMLAIYALPVGVLAGGVLIDTIGFRATGTLYSLVGVVLTLSMAWHWRPHVWSADLQAR